jgi:hypothetical protein
MSGRMAASRLAKIWGCCLSCSASKPFIWKRCMGMEKQAGQFSKITGRPACAAKSRVWRSRA